MSNRNGDNFLEEMELRRGPWTLEEDSLLIHYIARHGEGRWNLVAKCSGLKRTGKSCRLRWLNYLKPDVKRGNLTPEEQILILELHSKWGNRWSRIAQYLPGRTDNEIKNYWRTRIQKQARQLKIDANSTMFRDALRYFWMPWLLEKVRNPAAYQPLSQANSSAIEAPQPPLQGLLSSGYVHPGSENRSPSLNSEPVVIAQIPQISEHQPIPMASFGSFNPYNPAPNSQKIDNKDQMDALHLAFTPTSSLLGFPATDCSMIGESCFNSMEDSLWNMDELWHVQKLH